MVGAGALVVVEGGEVVDSGDLQAAKSRASETRDARPRHAIFLFTLTSFCSRAILCLPVRPPERTEFTRVIAPEMTKVNRRGQSPITKIQ